MGAAPQRGNEVSGASRGRGGNETLGLVGSGETWRRSSEEKMGTPSNKRLYGAPGGAAFPRQATQLVGLGDDGRGQQGLSVRQWYAGRAITGAVVGVHLKQETISEMVEDAFRIADAMIAAGGGSGD